MSDIEVLHPDHPKVYARWTVIIGGGKSPIKWTKRPPTTRQSTAKLSHIAKVQGSLEPAFASDERLRVKGKCWDYNPIVQRPYGLGVAKTLLRGW